MDRIIKVLTFGIVISAIWHKIETPWMPNNLGETNILLRAPRSMRLEPRQQGYYCNENECRPPNCRCASTKNPAGLPPSDIPQFLMVTFDDALYQSMWSGYAQDMIMKSAPDSLGCNARLTFYLTTMGTDFSLIQQAYDHGSEIADHTTTHANPTDFTVEQWSAELVASRNWSARLTPMDRSKVVGARAPWLVFGDNMFQAMQDDGFLYDASIIERHDYNKYPGISSKLGEWLWPYTFDYGSPQNIESTQGRNKVVGRFPGLWEVPMTVSVFPNDNRMANEMDPDGSADTIFELWKYNLLDRYNGNRSPYGIYMHGTWFQPGRTDIFLRFFKEAVSNHNVVYATPSQIIAWMKNPGNMEHTRKMPEFKCQSPPPPPSSGEVSYCSKGALSVCSYVEGPFISCNQCPVKMPGTSGTRNEPPEGLSPWEGFGKVKIDDNNVNFCGSITVSHNGQYSSYTWKAIIPVTGEAKIDNMWGGKFTTTKENGVTTFTLSATNGILPPGVVGGNDVGFCGTKSSNVKFPDSVYVSFGMSGSSTTSGTPISPPVINGETGNKGNSSKLKSSATSNLYGNMWIRLFYLYMGVYLL